MADNVLSVLLELKDELSSPLRAAGQVATSFGQTILGAGNNAEEASSHMAKLGETLADVAKTAAGFAAGNTLLALTHDIGEQFKELVTGTALYGEQVRQLSQNMGVSAQDASTLVTAMRELNIDMGSSTALAGGAEVAFIRFAKGLGGAEDAATGMAGSGKAVRDALSNLGVGVQQADGSIRPLMDILGDVAARFQAMPDSVQKTQEATTLFGRTGAELIPLLNLGRDGLDEVAASAKKYGLQLSGDNVASIRAFTLAHKELDTAIEGARVQIGEQLLPALTGAAGAMTEGVVAAVSFAHSIAFQDAASQVGAALGGVRDTLGGVKDGLRDAWDRSEGFRLVLTGLNEQLTGTGNGASADAAVLTKMGLAVVTLAVATQAATTAIATFGVVSTVVGPLAATVGTVTAAMLLARDATEVWTAAQIALDVAMDANPIGLVAVAIAAVVAAGAGMVVLFRALYDNVAPFTGAVNGLLGELHNLGDWLQQHVAVFQAWGEVIGFVHDRLTDGKNAVAGFTDGVKAQSQALQDQAAAQRAAMATAQEYADTIQKAGASGPTSTNLAALEDQKAALAQIATDTANNNRLIVEGNRAITDTKAQWAAVIDPLKAQKTAVDEAAAAVHDNLTAAMDGVKASAAAVIDPLQRQLDALNAIYDRLSLGIAEATGRVKVGYDNAVAPLLAQQAAIQATYDAITGPLKAAQADMALRYDDAIAPIQRQVDLLTQESALVTGPIQRSIEAIQVPAQQDIATKQHALALLGQQNTEIQYQAKLAEDAVRAADDPGIQDRQRALADLNGRFTDESQALGRAIQDETAGYRAQLDPLNAKLTALKQAVDLVDQQVALQEKSQNLAVSAALLAASGDPQQRAAIAAQLQINQAKEQTLALQIKAQQLASALAGTPATAATQPQTIVQASGLTVANPAYVAPQAATAPLSGAAREQAQLQLQDTQLQLRQAGLIDRAATDQLIAQQALLTVQQQSAALGRDQVDTQNQLAQIPLEAQIRTVAAAEAAALAPMQDQVAALTRQHQIEGTQLQDDIARRQRAEQDALAPILRQAATQQAAYDLDAHGRMLAINNLTEAEYQALTPKQQALAQAKLQFDLSTGPLKDALIALAIPEDARVAVMKEELTAWQLQYNTAHERLDPAIKSLQTEEQRRLAILTLQKENLDYQHTLDTGALALDISALQTAERLRLAPMQAQQAALDAQHKLYTDHLAADIKAQETAADAALKPMQDQVAALQAQNVQLGLEKTAIDGIAAATTAANAAQAGYASAFAASTARMGFAPPAAASGGLFTPSATESSAQVQKDFVAATGGDPNHPTAADVAKAAAAWQKQAGAGAGALLPGTGMPYNPDLKGIAWARQFIATGDTHDPNYWQDVGGSIETYCERFVENATGIVPPNGFSAATAWQSQLAAGRAVPTSDPSKVPPGAIAYYAANQGNGGFGHAGLSEGGGRMISANDKGITEDSIAAWSSGVAPLLGYVPAYATGTDFHPGGWAVVGERGPELVDLPRGSRVSPSGTGGGVTVNVTINALASVLDRATMDSFGRQLAPYLRQVGGYAT